MEGKYGAGAEEKRRPAWPNPNVGDRPNIQITYVNVERDKIIPKNIRVEGINNNSMLKSEQRSAVLHDILQVSKFDHQTFLMMMRWMDDGLMTRRDH